MKQTISVTESQFVDEIVNDEYNNMSYEGARALYEYLEERENSCDEEMTFNRIAIRCQYSEYENLEAIRENHRDIKTLEDLNYKTVVLEVPDSDKLVIESF